MTTWWTDEAILAVARRVCTPEQYEVVEMISRGKSRREIAAALGIDRGSVRDRLAAGGRRIRAEIEKGRET